MADKLIQFTEKIKATYPDNYAEIVKTHYTNQPKAFRINTDPAKYSETIKKLQDQGFEVAQTEIANAFVLKHAVENTRLSDTPENISGEIYMQELSSMLPAIVLDPKAKELILDMCAAPGSKTSQLATLAPESLIIAVEKSRERFFKLKQTLERQNVNNVQLVLADANRLLKTNPSFENYFDKILLDAPCSNEAGVDLSAKDPFKFWNSKKSSFLAKLQKGLLNNAFKMLKPGGTLIYSTCTYAVEENEAVVNWLLKRNADASLDQISIPITNIYTGITNYKEKVLADDLAKTIRVIPNDIYKGFYISKIHKAVSY